MNFIVSWVLELFKKPEFVVAIEPVQKAKPAVKKAPAVKKPAARKSVKKTVKKAR
jgi:hypothetical protein